MKQSFNKRETSNAASQKHHRIKNLADLTFSILLIWHIGSVIAWLGSSAAFVFAIYPSVRSVTKDQNILSFRSFLPSFSKVIAGASISTVLAGIFLFGYISSIDTSRMPTGWNLIFILIGALLGLVAIILTLGVISPLISRFMKQSGQDLNVSGNYSSMKIEKSEREIESLTGSINSVTFSLVLMLLIVEILMTLGIYF